MVANQLFLYYLKVSNLDDKPYSSAGSLEDYAENTISPVLYLTLESLGMIRHDGSINYLTHSVNSSV